MIMFILLVPAALLGMLVCMDRLERWAVEGAEDQPARRVRTDTAA